MIGIVVVLPLNTANRYYGCRGECSERSLWIYHRLAQDPEPVESVFIGSSRAISAFEDALISEVHPHTVNMGFCRLGRDLQYQLLTDLLRYKSPKTVYLEIRSSENDVSHPVAPYFLESAHLLSAPIRQNPDYFTNLWKHGVFKLSAFQNLIYGREDTLGNHRSTGYPIWVDDRIWQADQGAFDPSRNASKEVKPVSGLARYYLQAMADVCAEHDVQLKFIYLPSAKTIGAAIDTASYHIWSDQLFYVPNDILTNPNYWSDADHFNHDGAVAVSRCFLGKMNGNSLNN